MKKRFKKLVVLGMVVAMAVSSTLCVSAAGLRDVFNAKYYADSYPDLKAAFGDNEEALYKHFIDYGLKENRQMNPIIDIQAYRKAYPDLEAAFGENWDAYVNHFFAYGAYEGRTQGVLFNPIKYAEAYPDVAAAYGTDIQAITNHYLTCGIAEGRTAGVTVAAPASAASGGGSSSSSSSSSSGTSTPSTPTTPTTPTTPDVSNNDPSAPDEPTVTLPTVKVYKEVTLSGSTISSLGTDTDVAITGGKGTAREPYTATVSDIKKVKGTDDNYWFAVALPCADATDMNYWIKMGSWTNVSNNVTEGLNVPAAHMVFAVGDDGNGGSLDLCMSKATDAGSLESAEGTFYRFSVGFAADSGEEEDTGEEKTVKIYNAVTYDAAGNISALNSPRDVTFTGKGTSGEPYVNETAVDITTIKGITTHWFVTAVPDSDENMKQWLKIGNKWVNVSGNQKKPESGTIESGHMGFGIGLQGDGEGTVELCVSSNTAAEADTLEGTFYTVKINLLTPPSDVSGNG